MTREGALPLVGPLRSAGLFAWIGLLTSVGLSGCPRSAPKGFVNPPADGVTITDPISADRCTKGPLTRSAVLEARTYYFCAIESQRAFVARHTSK